jgi:hypothetical protein
MRTVFRPTHAWPRWGFDRATVRAFVDLCERTWPDPSSFEFQLIRGERADEAGSADEARQLLDMEGSVPEATAITLAVEGPHDGLASMSFTWFGTYASLSIVARDEIAGDSLRRRAVEILDRGEVRLSERPADKPQNVETQFRVSQSWPHWKASDAVLHAILDLCERTWPEVSVVDFRLARVDRSDRADSLDLARRLIDEPGVLSSATGIELIVIASGSSTQSLSVRSEIDAAASLSVAGPDELAVSALRDRASAILAAGAVDPQSEAVGVAVARVEQETELSLERVRFAGTYADLDGLIRDLADQVAQVSGSLSRVYIALTEHGHTVTVHHLADLHQITARRVRDLRHLSVSLRGPDGVALSLYTSMHGRALGATMHGYARGPDEATIRTLRATANDVLRTRGRTPHWLTYRVLVAAGVVLFAAGTILENILEARASGIALILGSALLYASPLYLPDVELLRDGERTRWSRSSRYILALGVAWLIGSLAIPIVDR